jgi:hypothetical protein
MTPSRAQLAALFAALLMLSPTVYGCVIFKADVDAVSGTVSGSLVDNGGQICTLQPASWAVPGTYVFACVDGYSMTWTADNSGEPPSGSATYNTNHGQFVFATPEDLTGNGCYLACNYNCAGPCTC